MGSITRTRQLFFVGVLFGVGFDTATEVLLLAGTAAAVTEGLPWYAVLTLPLLFSGGMTLFDSIDGLFMNFAYGWAFARPVRKVYYNLTITGAVGGGRVPGRRDRDRRADLERVASPWLARGLARERRPQHRRVHIVGLFVVVWALALSIWRFGRVEARWEAAARTSSSLASSPGGELEALGLDQ